LFFLSAFWSCFAELPVSDQPGVIVVVGAGGEEEFAGQFSTWAGLWEAASRRAGARHTVLGLTPGRTNDIEALKQALAAEPREGNGELWLVLIGHGTYSGKEAKFNLRGPDFTPIELAEWLKPIHRPMAVINTASSSAPFISALSKTNRVIVTATRSGFEQNFARFGQYLAEALTDPQSDFDHDGQVSLLESFLLASRRTADFYKTNGRLATEHALLDDNGDGRGTPPDWFSGVRATRKAKDGASVDGLRAHQFHLVRNAQEQKLSPETRARRDALELSIAQLRDHKKDLPEERYYHELEKLLLELARLYHQDDTGK
jgi:hypothetical protein